MQTDMKKPFTQREKEFEFKGEIQKQRTGIFH